MNTQAKPLKVAPNGIVEKVAWAAIRNRALLFARSRGQELFYSLGGKVNVGETLEQAIVRESREEASVDLIEETIKHLHTFDGPCHGYVEGTVLKMSYFLADAVGEPTASEEVVELAWFTTRDKHRTTPMGVQIIDWFAENDYID